MTGSFAQNIESWKTLISEAFIINANAGYKLEFVSEPVLLLNNTVKQRLNLPTL